MNDEVVFAMLPDECRTGGKMMSNDIFSMYTKEQNIKHGRHCYGLWKQEKETIIPPNKYGIFLAERKKR